MSNKKQASTVMMIEDDHSNDDNNTECLTLMPNTHRRRRRDATKQFRRVGVGGVYWALASTQHTVSKRFWLIFVSLSLTGKGVRRAQSPQGARNSPASPPTVIPPTCHCSQWPDIEEGTC